MRKVDFRAASVGSAALILSGVAVLASTAMFSGSAVAQPTFGQVTIIPTTETKCLVGDAGKCSIIATDGKTFTQIQFETGGKTYIGTKIFENKTPTGGVAESFNSEDFVQVAIGTGQAATSGIMSRSSLTAGTEFKSSSDVLGGWAAPAGTPAGGSQVKINLEVANAAGQGLFNQKFDATVVFDPTNNTNKATGLRIDQTVGLSADAKVLTDKQRFVTQISDAKSTAPIVLAQGTAGGVSYDVGTGQIVWVGQAIGGVGQFGTTSVSNPTAGTATFTTSLTSSLPVSPWPTPGFGTAPVF